MPRLPVVQRGRQVRTAGRRVHVELRAVGGRADEVTTALIAALEARPEVAWTQLVPRMQRLVVGLHEERADDQVRKIVAQVEEELGVHHQPFVEDAPDHPSDVEALGRQLLALGGDAAGLGLGLIRRFVPAPVRAAATDVAVMVGVTQHVPRFREAVEHRVGWPIVGAALEVTGAVSSGLGQGPLGPLVDLVHRASSIAEADARRRAWEAAEPELFAARGPTAAVLATSARPVPVPRGPVERYAERAWPVSLGAFAVALPFTGSLERATAMLSAGLPKAARLGRESFAVHLSRGLAARGAVVLDARVLRLLDRVSTVVLDARLLAGGDDVAATVERAGLALCIAGSAPARSRFGPHEVVPDDLHLAAEVRRRQQAGEVVLVIGTAQTNAGLAVADCAIGIAGTGHPTPWSAHVLCPADRGLASLVVEACPVAQEVSSQSAGIALAGASVAGLVSFTGLVPGLANRATSAVNLATAVAVANGARAALGVTRRPIPPPRDPTPWHSLPVEEVLDRLGSSWQGLDEVAALARLEVPAPVDPTLVSVAKAVGAELVNPLTPILAAGTGLSLAVGSVLDAAMVGGVVGLNALIGGIQTHQANRAVADLGARAVEQVVVRRSGVEQRVPSDTLVQGDVIRLEAGDAVPADCRIIEASAVETDESSLTGESLPVAKATAPTRATDLAERSSMLYDGTAVASGSCWAVVVAVSSATEAGRAVELAGERAHPGGVEARLRSLTDLTVPIAAASGLGIVGLGLLRGRPLTEIASSGVSLTVAAVPEGLPLLATVAQLAAARRLSQRGVVVRSPRAIEALGRVDVLCADKTGTLTEGRIRVGAVSDGMDEHPIDELEGAAAQILAVGLRATPRATNGRRLPHLTDRALVHAHEATGIHPGDGIQGWSAVAALPFEPGRGYHAVLGSTHGKRLLSVKGAPELILPLCTTWAHPSGRSRRLDPAARAGLAATVDRLALSGYRMLAVAERSVPDTFELDDASVRQLRFRGFLCLADPVRDTAQEAIARIRRAGIRVVMITGDHPSTAEGIAAELDLVEGEAVITGAELDELDDDALDDRLGTVTVFARVTPAHKVRIVRAYQRAGRVVAMTGDGANDAPAIRLADVGIALGTRSTAAARGAADLVVLDNRIETIVDAIVEGRGMWGSVRDAVAMLVGGNLGEIGFTVAGSLVGGSTPLNARQLLVVNLLTDVAPAMAVAVRPQGGVSPDALLREGPDASLGESLNRLIALRAVVTGTSAGAAWLVARATGTAGRASTVGMAALVGTQLGQTLAVGGRDPLVLAAGLGSAAVLVGLVQTPGVSQLFGCRPMGPVGWGIALSAATAGTAASLILPQLLPAGPAPDPGA
ncbi:MAG TPA: cation-transporting P-type ATPase [Acidimicrobiales bacterium]|nr:cation-transporting P-type ATPase [Acidimicrobiales bacterium]